MSKIEKIELPESNLWGYLMEFKSVVGNTHKIQHICKDIDGDLHTHTSLITSIGTDRERQIIIPPQEVRNLMDYFGSIDIDESNNYLEFEK